MAGRAHPSLLRRAAAALGLAPRMSAAYDGAANTRRTREWKRVGGDANTITLREAASLIEAARHLARNNPDAVSGISVLVNNTVGTGIAPHVTPPRPDGPTRTDARRRAVEAVLKAHCDTTAIDADGLSTLYGIERVAYQALVQDGEVLLRRRRRRAEDALPLPFQIQVLEADYLDRSRNETVTVDGAVVGRIVQGVEFDALGRRVAYWLYREHPSGQIMPWRFESVRISADDIVHLFRIDRPGQVRGIPWLAPAVPVFMELHAYLDAQLVRQKIAAMYGAFVYSPESASIAGTETETENGQTIETETLEPGLKTVLPPGWDIRFSSPPDVGGLETVTPLYQRRIARALGITYEALTGDLSGVNFSSARMGWLEMNRGIQAMQQAMILPQMCLPIERWLREAIAIQTGSAEPFGLIWSMPRRDMIDPAKEVGALADMVAAGFRTRSSVIRELGDDPDDVRREFADDAVAEAALGLAFDAPAPTAAAPAPTTQEP